MTWSGDLYGKWLNKNTNWGVRCPFFKRRNVSSKNETWIKRKGKKIIKRNVTARQLTADQIIRLQRRRLVEGEHMFSWALGRKRRRRTAARSRGWDGREQINAATRRQRGSGLSKPERPVAAAPLARLPHQLSLSCGRTGDDVTAGRHPTGLARASLSHFHDILIRANTCDHQRAAEEQFPLFSFLSKQNKTKTKCPFWILFFWFLALKFKPVDRYYR